MPDNTVEQGVKNIEGWLKDVKDLDQIEEQLKHDSFIAEGAGWLTQIAGGSDMLMTVLEKLTGKAGKGIKEGYDLLKTIGESYNSAVEDKDFISASLKAVNGYAQHSGKEGLGLTTSLLDIINGDSSPAEKKVAIITELSKFAKQELSGAVGDILLSGKKILDGQKMVAEEQDFRQRMLQEIYEQRAKLNYKIKKQQNEIDKLINPAGSGNSLASSGNQSSGGPASANVFTRIDELLAQINASLQQLDANLQV